jgi:hypothetical protein
MKLDFADVKPSVTSWLTVGIMALTFIVLMKWAVHKWPIPGLSDVVNAA